MHRLGYSSVVMYAPGLAAGNGAGESGGSTAATAGSNGISNEFTPGPAGGLKSWPIWDEATKAAAQSAAAARGRNDNITCCDLHPGKDSVDWDKDCHRVDVMKPNFTHMDFERRLPGYTGGGTARR